MVPVPVTPLPGPAGRVQHLSASNPHDAGALAAAAVDEGAVAVTVADTPSSSGAVRVSIVWPAPGRRR